VALLASLATLASAQNTLEIIPLRHRTAEQVLPMVPPGAGNTEMLVAPPIGATSIGPARTAVREDAEA